MAPLAARRLAKMVSFGERIAAIELVIAAQALDLKERKTIGQGVRRARDAVRKVIPFLGERESITGDLEALVHVAREEISQI